MDVKEHKSFTTSSAGIFHGAHNVQIGRAKFTNVAGDSTVNSFNTFVLVKQQSSAVDVRSVIILLILAFLFLFLFFLL